MLRTILEILAYLLLFLALRAFLRGMFAGPRRDSGSSRVETPPPPPSVPTGGELKKDPVCGTYVSTAVSLTRKVNGEVYYFCSKECRDRYEGSR
ncbi:MAG: transcriptional regulator [Acidobacteriia bacterium]|nr:transcriptional regulator [Terriglobia bacterium]